MAEKRSIAKKLTDEDLFVMMPSSAQALYLHLMMAADDDGFVDTTCTCMYKAHATPEDLRTLVERGYVLTFDSCGVIVVTSWRISNTIRRDSYKSTRYLEELSQLYIDSYGAYTKAPTDTPATPLFEAPAPVKAIEAKPAKPAKKASAKPPKRVYGEYKHVRLTDEEKSKLEAEYGVDKTAAAIDFFDEYVEAKGYKHSSSYLCIRRWVMDAVNEKAARSGKSYGQTPAGHSDAETWAAIKEALSDAGYRPQAAWESMPEYVKKAVSAEQLHSWATMPGYNESVVMAQALKLVKGGGG